MKQSNQSLNEEALAASTNSIHIG